MKAAADKAAADTAAAEKEAANKSISTRSIWLPAQWLAELLRCQRGDVRIQRMYFVMRGMLWLVVGWNGGLALEPIKGPGTFGNKTRAAMILRSRRRPRLVIPAGLALGL